MSTQKKNYLKPPPSLPSLPPQQLLEATDSNSTIYHRPANHSSQHQRTPLAIMFKQATVRHLTGILDITC
jgi:hypothetical protein